MGPLLKKEIEMSGKMTKMVMHDLESHYLSVYKQSEEGYTSSPKKKKYCSTHGISQENCKLSYGTIQGHRPTKEQSSKTYQGFSAEVVLEFPTSEAKLNQNVPTNPCENSFFALEALFETSDKRNLSSMSKASTSKRDASSKPMVILDKAISTSEAEYYPQNYEIEPSLFESLREHELSLSNLSVKDPFSMANVSHNNSFFNLLNYFPQKAPSICSRKKLLILDINGILADIIYPPPKGYKADTKIAGRAVFTRPFCSDFLKFCVERFNVAIWSSRSRKVIDRLVNYLMGDMKDKLIFCWDLSYCTQSNFRTLENKHKALVFKELRKVWESYDSDLLWKKGEFNESNTFLLDDTPYKALLNPPHTAIFPYSYDFKDREDDSIGPGGNIRAYLEEIAKAEDVQEYIEQHPFGQSAITERSLSWQFYDKVIKGQSRVAAGG